MPLSVVTGTRVCLSLLLLIVSFPAVGNVDCTDDCVPVGQWQVNLAVGVGLRENPLVGGEHTPLVVLPEISWYGKRFFLNNLEFGMTLLENRRHQFSALLTPSYQQMHFNRWDPFNLFEISSGTALGEAGNSSLIDADDQARETLSSQDVRHRKMAGLAGFEYLYSGQGWQWHAQALQDVSGVHRGNEVRMALILPRQIREHRIALTLGTNYQSRKVLDYYYGVHPADTARTDLQFAPASAGFGHMVRVDWQKPVSERWSLRGLIKLTSLADEIQGSPLVAQDYSAAVFVGGVYHF